MSPIHRPLPTLASLNIPPCAVILAFLREVLHVPTPERLLVRDFQFITEIPMALRLRGIPTHYAMVITLDSPLPAIGNVLRFSLEQENGGYVITEMVFEPGWSGEQHGL